MQIKKLLLLCLSVACFALACLPASSTAPAAGEKKKLFFDLPAFFAQEAQRLGAKRVEKRSRAASDAGSTVIDTTRHQIESPEQWERELALFARVQLNKSSFSDQYDIDSLRNDSTGTLTLRYRARKEHLYTQLVEIRLLNEQVQHISLLNRQSSLLTESRQQLQYTPDKGYSLQQTQRLPFAEPHTVELYAIFY